MPLVHNFADLLGFATQVGADTLINFGGGDTITLKGVLRANLSPDDFRFDAPPTITSNGGDSATVSTPENTVAVTTVTATDPDVGTTLTYSISGGADAMLFQINASTGALSFISAPDFEHPTDTDHNNTYLVQVRAFDGILFDEQLLTVTVLDVNDTIGGPGADTLIGTSGDDLLDGQGGDDVIVAGTGNDVVFAGSGNDIVGGGPGNDTILGQDGNDTIGGDDGDDQVNGGDGARCDLRRGR